MRLFLIGIVTLFFLGTLSTPSPAQMYWNSGVSDNETAVGDSQSKGYKPQKLAQSQKSTPKSDVREGAEKTQQPVSKKSRVKAPKGCPSVIGGK